MKNFQEFFETRFPEDKEKLNDKAKLGSTQSL